MPPSPWQTICGILAPEAVRLHTIPKGIHMLAPYSAPVVVDYGSIAEATFVTPAVARKNKIPVGNTRKLRDGNYACSSEAGKYAGQGGKNYLVLNCDKFGEYSHGDSTGS